MLHLVERQPHPVRVGRVGYTSPLMLVVLRQHKMVLTSCTADNATDDPMKLRSQCLGHFFISLSRRAERSDQIRLGFGRLDQGCGHGWSSRTGTWVPGSMPSSAPTGTSSSASTGAGEVHRGQALALVGEDARVERVGSVHLVIDDPGDVD